MEIVLLRQPATPIDTHSATPESLRQLGFQLYPAAPDLERYVRHYWCIDRPDGVYCQRELLHPENGSGIVFQFGDRLSLGGQRWPRQGVYDGSQTRSVRLELSGVVRAFGVRFQPGGATALISGVAAELKNGYASLSELGFEDASGLYQQLAGAVSATSMVMVVESWLRCHLDCRYRLAAPVAQALQRMCRVQGVVEIDALAGHLSLSRRSLERHFRAHLGVTPKECASAYRVAEARRLLMATTEPGTAIGHRLGYSDQAHFIRQFQQVVGMTPRAYRRRRG